MFVSGVIYASAAFFILAGVLKLAHSSTPTVVKRALPPGLSAALVWRSLGCLEVLSGSLVIFGNRYGVGMLAVLATLFAGFLTYAWRRGWQESCGCLGARHRERIGLRSLSRAVLIATSAAYVAFTNLRALEAGALSCWLGLLTGGVALLLLSVEPPRMVASFLPHAAVRVLSRRELLRHPTFSVLAAEYSLGRHETHYGPGLDGGPAFTFIAPDVGEGAAQILFTLTRSPSGQVVVHAAVAGH